MTADTTKNRTPKKRVHKAAAAAVAAACAAGAAASIGLSVTSAQAAGAAVYDPWNVVGLGFRTYGEAERDIEHTEQECVREDGIIGPSWVESGYFIPNLRVESYRAVTRCLPPPR